MKLCIIGDLGSIHFYRNIYSLKKLKHEILILNNSKAFWGELPQNYCVKTIPSECLRNSENIICWVKNEIENFKPDIIHTYAPFYLGFTPFFSEKKYPLIITYQDGLALFDKSVHSFVKRMIDISAEYSEAYILATFSEDLMRNFEKRGFKREKTFYLPFYTDTNYFKKKEKESFLDKLRKKLNIDKNDTVIFSPRAPSIPANVDIIAKTIDEITENNKNVKYIFAGHGCDMHILTNLVSVFNRVKNKKNVIWLGFIKDKRLLRAIYQISDIYVSLFCDFGFSPVSLKEALLCGLIPVIGEHHGDNFWIKDKKNGFIVKQRNVSELVEALKGAVNIIKNKEFKKYAEDNKRMVLERFDYNDFGNEFDKIYNTVKTEFALNKTDVSYFNPENYFRRNQYEQYSQDHIPEIENLKIRTFDMQFYLTAENPNPLEVSYIIKILSYLYMNKRADNDEEKIILILKELSEKLFYDIDYLAKQFFSYCRRLKKPELFLNFKDYFLYPSPDMMGNYLFAYEYFLQRQITNEALIYKKLVLSSIDIIEASIFKLNFKDTLEVYKKRVN